MKFPATAAVLALAFLTLAPGASAETCRRSTLVDYAAPLAQLPPLPELEREGPSDLPFGPDGLVLEHRGAGEAILPGAETVGYRLRSTAKRVLRLGWTVTTRITEVGPDGARRGELTAERERLRALKPKARVGFLMYLTSAPGYYRVQIVFRNRSGKLLGRYGEYLRILTGSFDARFTVDRPTVAPGETISPRLENPGAALLSFGLAAPVERFDGSTWTPAPFGNGPVAEILLYADVGQSVACWPLAIPADAAPGPYRFTLDFRYQTRTGRQPVGGNEKRTAEFQIVPAT